MVLMKYDVCVVFSVDALNDDDALDTVINYLPVKRFPIDWEWIYTTQTKESKCTSYSTVSLRL